MDWINKAKMGMRRCHLGLKRSISSTMLYNINISRRMGYTSQRLGGFITSAGGRNGDRLSQYVLLRISSEARKLRGSGCTVAQREGINNFHLLPFGKEGCADVKKAMRQQQNKLSDYHGGHHR